LDESPGSLFLVLEPQQNAVVPVKLILALPIPSVDALLARREPRAVRQVFKGETIAVHELAKFL
jgi:hypothetical protein